MVTPHLILAMFLAAQACDGLFTYFAVQTYGIMAEGNVLLATWIALVGAGPALMGAKLMAAGCGVLLYWLDQRAVLLGLTVFYGVVAVGPWMSIFHQLYFHQL